MRKVMALLLVLLLLCACAGERREESIFIYYPAVDALGEGDDSLGREVWRQVPSEVNVETLAERMLTPPEDGDLYAIFPSGLRLRGWSVEQRVLTLNFSEPYSALTGIRLTLANCCAALTFAQLPGVDRVSIQVEGQDLPEGSSGPFSPENLLRTGETD